MKTRQYKVKGPHLSRVLHRPSTLLLEPTFLLHLFVKLNVLFIFQTNILCCVNGPFLLS